MTVLQLGMGGEELCTLDLLHTAGLVNYFGQNPEVDAVSINPILLEKGITRVALYGLGNLRDERLTRMWQDGRIKFRRPAAEGSDQHNGAGEEVDSDTESQYAQFFNIFVMHQNRVRRPAKVSPQRCAAACNLIH